MQPRSSWRRREARGAKMPRRERRARLDGRHVAGIEVLLDVVFPDPECSTDPDGRDLARTDQSIHGHLRNPHALSDLQGGQEQGAAGRGRPRHRSPSAYSSGIVASVSDAPKGSEGLPSCSGLMFRGCRFARSAPGGVSRGSRVPGRPPAARRASAPRCRRAARPRRSCAGPWPPRSPGRSRR